MLKEYLAYAEELRPYVTDTGVILDEIFASGKRSSSRAPRPPSSTSTTAPIRM